MSGLDREEILRRDCPRCKGNGYITLPSGAQDSCPDCEGSGLIEKTVPYNFENDRKGKRPDEELAEIWDVPEEEVPNIDKGHSTGD